MISQRALSPWNGLNNVEIFLVGFALVSILAFSPADFDVDLGISLSFPADDIAHGLTPPIFGISKFIYH